jgi:hypothetical protein
MTGFPKLTIDEMVHIDRVIASLDQAARDLADLKHVLLGGGRAEPLPNRTEPCASNGVDRAAFEARLKQIVKADARRAKQQQREKLAGTALPVEPDDDAA